MLKLAKLLGINCLALTTAIALAPHQPVNAHSVCGLRPEEASFKTQSYLITICLGEASFQMVVTYYDGTGYQIIPVNQEGNLFRGTDGQRNFIIDNQTFVIGTDGEVPIRERVIEYQ